MPGAEVVVQVKFCVMQLTRRITSQPNCCRNFCFFLNISFIPIITISLNIFIWKYYCHSFQLAHTTTSQLLRSLSSRDRSAHTETWRLAEESPLFAMLPRLVDLNHLVMNLISCHFRDLDVLQVMSVRLWRWEPTAVKHLVRSDYGFKINR